MTQFLFDAVSRWASVEWGRGNEDPGRCPFFVWRFIASNEDKGEAIARIVSEFEGKERWTARKPGRNWIIQPLALSQYIAKSQLNDDLAATDEFTRLFPERVANAVSDLPALAAEIARRAAPDAMEGGKVAPDG